MYVISISTYKLKPYFLDKPFAIFRQWSSVCCHGYTASACSFFIRSLRSRFLSATMRLSKSTISFLRASSLLLGANSLTLGSDFADDIEERRERESLWCLRDKRDVYSREKCLDCEWDRESCESCESRERECEFRVLDSRDSDLLDCGPLDLDRGSRDREFLVLDFCDRECRDLEFREVDSELERDRAYSFVRLFWIFSPRFVLWQ